MTELTWHWVPALQSITSACMLVSGQLAHCAPSPKHMSASSRTKAVAGKRGTQMSFTVCAHAVLAFSEGASSHAGRRAGEHGDRSRRRWDSGQPHRNGRSGCTTAMTVPAISVPHWHCASEHSQVLLEAYLIQMAVWKLEAYLGIFTYRH